MGGKSGSTKISRYNMSLHMGVCHGPVDAVKGIVVGEKSAWTGSLTSNATQTISKEGLFGGIKKEGGLKGAVEFMFGGPSQVVSTDLASRLGRSVADCPGFRGILSLFFRGLGSPRGFYWAASNPYLKDIWVTVERCPDALQMETARILRSASDLSLQLGATSTGWKYLVTDLSNSADYSGEFFDDSGWSVGQSPFAYPAGHPYSEDTGFPAISNTVWPLNTKLWARRTFNLAEVASVNMTIFVDNYTTVWVNGTLVLPRVGTISGPSGPIFTHAFTIPAGILHAGDNVLATMCEDYGTYTYAAFRIDGYGSDVTHDANPAHVIYECLTNTDWGMGASTDSIDTDSFRAAGQTLFDEQFGIFMQWQQQSTIEDFINDVLDHIKGALFPNPRSGKLTLKLLRDDYDVTTLPELNADNCAVRNFSRKNWGETSNEIVVTWTNPVNESEETVFAQDLGNMSIQGGLVSDSRNYYGVRTLSLAQKLADRELRSSSAPLCSCEVVTDRSFWSITPFDCVKLHYPEYGIENLVMRVFAVNYGQTGDSSIKLSLTEDVFGLPYATYVAPPAGESTRPNQPPVPIQNVRLMSMPAYAITQAGEDLSAMTYPDTEMTLFAQNPTTSDTAFYDIYIQDTSPSGIVSWAPAGDNQQFEGRGTLTGALTQQVTSSSVPQITGAYADVDTFLIIGSDALAETQLEIALVTAVDGVTGNLTLMRGVLDTTPRDWPAGTRVWLTNANTMDIVPGGATDGQTVSVRPATITPYGSIDEADVPTFSATAHARAVLPLRPANVKVDGVGFGTVTPNPSTPMVRAITWNHRNRLLEDSQVLAWDAASVSVEAGVTYVVKSTAYNPSGGVLSTNWLNVNVGTVATYTLNLVTTPPPAGSGSIDIRVYAVRDGHESWQAHQIFTTLSLTAPSGLTAVYSE